MLPGEERAPDDPGYHNEGGYVWDAEFKRINPAYFDYADRRIFHLIQAEITPVIFGAWRTHLAQMGLEKMKKHWRYIVARYSAYPVIWVAGGEVYDPPGGQSNPGFQSSSPLYKALYSPGWTEVVRYIRAIDPSGRLLSVHEVDPPFDDCIQDESLKDFDLFQAGHRGWPSIATAIALLNMHYARTSVAKPLVVGEIGLEGINGEHMADYQRTAFWLSMLNGAAGFSYSNVLIANSYSIEKPFHIIKYSLLDWQEGLQLPGAYQTSLGANLLKQYAWHRFAPHPEWITPAGTTLLEPQTAVGGFDIDLVAALNTSTQQLENDIPAGEWRRKKGNFRLPYAAGIPGEVRFIYLPYRPAMLFSPNYDLKVLELEPNVSYHVYYWEPSLGVKFDLGVVESLGVAGPGRVKRSEWGRKLYDAQGRYRGSLTGKYWDKYGDEQSVQGTTYSPPKPPLTGGDFLLVMERM